MLYFEVINIYCCRGHNHNLRVERQKDSQQERRQRHQDEQRRRIPGLRQTTQQRYSKAERHRYDNKLTLGSLRS